MVEKLELETLHVKPKTFAKAVFAANDTQEVIVEKAKKPKAFWERFWRRNKIEREGYVAVILLKEDGNAETVEIKTKKGFFEINGKTYHERKDCTYTMGKERIPLAIIPEWSLIPYGTKPWHDREMLEKIAECQDHCLRGIRHAELVRMGDKETMKINARQVILMLIGVVIVGAVAVNYI